MTLARAPILRISRKKTSRKRSRPETKEAADCVTLHSLFARPREARAAARDLESPDWREEIRRERKGRILIVHRHAPGPRCPPRRAQRRRVRPGDQSLREPTSPWQLKATLGVSRSRRTPVGQSVGATEGVSIETVVPFIQAGGRRTMRPL